METIEVTIERLMLNGENGHAPLNYDQATNVAWGRPRDYVAVYDCETTETNTGSVSK